MENITAAMWHFQIHIARAGAWLRAANIGQHVVSIIEIDIGQLWRYSRPVSQMA